MRYNWLYIALAFGLTIGAISLWDAPPKLLIPLGGDKEAAQRFPYAVIDDAHSRHFDADGELSYEFVADTLSHFRIDLDEISDDDYVILEAPRLTLYTEAAPWFVTAQEGRVSERGAMLTLWQDVRVWQMLPEAEEGEVTELTTERLTIVPQEKTVQTDAAVNLTSPQGKMEAIGMVVDLSTRNIQLLNNVRGYHEPM